MKIIIFVLNIIFIIFLTTDFVEGSSIRIGAFGDSITQGTGFNLVMCGRSYTHLGSYRYYLTTMLEKENIPHDMVGLWGENDGGAWFIGEEARYNDNNWMLSDMLDMDHTGWGGITAKGLVDYLLQVDGAQQLFPKPNPEGSIAILHIGTNDVLQSLSIEETILNVRTFIVYMTEHDPSISIVICQILPNHPELNYWVNTYNLRLKELVEEISESQNNLYLVDMNTPMKDIWPLMSTDSIHPNCDGYHLMASILYSYIMDQGIIPITCGGIN